MSFTVDSILDFYMKIFFNMLWPILHDLFMFFHVLTMNSRETCLMWLGNNTIPTPFPWRLITWDCPCHATFPIRCRSQSFQPRWSLRIIENHWESLRIIEVPRWPSKWWCHWACRRRSASACWAVSKVVGPSWVATSWDKVLLPCRRRWSKRWMTRPGPKTALTKKSPNGIIDAFVVERCRTNTYQILSNALGMTRSRSLMLAYACRVGLTNARWRCT